MKKYTVTVILEPHCKEYSGRRYLKMEALANSREEAIEKVYGFMKDMVQDFVKVIVQ